MGIAAAFLAYFMINAFLIYPFRAKLYIWPIIKWLQNIQSQYARGFFGLFAFWPMTLHYVFSELWSAVGMGFIIWGYVNMINTKSAAHRYYALLPALGQLGQILASVILDQVSDGSKSGFWSFETTVYWINASIAVILVLFILNIWFLDRVIMKKPRFASQATSKKSTKKDAKPTLCSSLKFVFQNYHVLAILVIIFSQGAFEVMEQLTYKDAANTFFKGDASAYTKWKSFEQLMTAVVALICILFVGSNVLRMFGYRVTALMTPLFVVGMGTFFYVTSFTTKTYFYGVYFKSLTSTGYGMSDTGSGSLLFLAWLGWFLNVGMQGFKYSVFDATKEIAYLNLTKEERIRAKAVGDIIGQRGGKSFAALINCFLLPLFGGASVLAIERRFTILTFSIMCVEVTIWILGVFYLARYISNKETREEKEKMEADKELYPAPHVGAGTVDKLPKETMLSRN
jgi:AAA family ATP:ADP antiporter